MPTQTRKKYERFIFKDYQLEGQKIKFFYTLSANHLPPLDFCECLELPPTVPPPNPQDQNLAKLLDACHKVLGLSYYKTYLPETIVASPVSPLDAVFWQELYSVGLGEFYFRNNLPLPQHLQFPTQTTQTTQAQRFEVGSIKTHMEPKIMVLMGGGKDSAVVCSIAKHVSNSCIGFSLGDNFWAAKTAESAGLPYIQVKRTLDPALFQLPDARNGHIPISACIAFVSTLVAYLLGCNYVIAGNERGADEGNVELAGTTINHQWSKGSHFEDLFQQWCRRNLGGGPSYFSLLRPLSEIHIAKLFAQLPDLHPAFSSCNGNFKLHPQGLNQRWCGRCAKCVFTALLLKPHLTDEAYRHIFLADFLENPQNQTTLLNLLGLGTMKPWDCVGTFMESKLCFTMLYQQQRLSGMAWEVAQTYPEACVSEDFRDQWQKHLTPTHQHFLPPTWLPQIYAYY
ncbi:MAG: hypothetical protein QM520_05185 [Gammaproteobacteria bacterium]|nr:hypothetical protein [Gammaproteobacteria bacterium]